MGLTRSERLGVVEGWASQLYQVLGSMEKQNGDQGDDVEALVRVAWTLLYRESQNLKAPGIG